MLAASVALTPGIAVHAAAIVASPTSVNSEYLGDVALSITGLANGQTVVIEKFADVDGSGTIDSTEPLVQSFRITDGQVTSVGGVRNTNVPGDNDGAANGEIRTGIHFRMQEVDRFAGRFLYKVSPVTRQRGPWKRLRHSWWRRMMIVARPKPSPTFT